MVARLFLILAALALPLFAAPVQPFAQAVSLPDKRPPQLSGAEKSVPAKPGDDDEEDEDDEDDEEEEDEADEKASGPDPLGATSRKGEVEGIPPVPTRAEAPSLRKPKRAAEPLGPEPPPDKWSDREIAEASSQCGKLLPEGRYEMKLLPPIREGVCGTPAPVQLKYFNHAPRVELRPAATMTCPLADALNRWMTEVVQPRAKALLHANVIRVGNMAAYHCRTRYNDPMQRMSHHAFADALDIGEFMTAKGERINVLEHWPAGDERAQFLREVHEGACKIFGTVLGPEANAAHRNHFHFDMAKRRHSSYCQ